MRLIGYIRRVFDWLLNGLLAVLLICNVYTITVRYFTGAVQPDIFGWSWAVVISGSMEPDIGVNDLIIVQEKDAYISGDVISFDTGRGVVTHRIIEVKPEGYVTQGDVNNTPDLAVVPREKVIGKVEFVIPKAGVFIEYLQSPLGMTCLVLLGILLIEIPHLKDISKRRS